MTNQIEVEYQGKMVEIELTEEQIVSLKKQIAECELERIKGQEFFYLDLVTDRVLSTQDDFSDWDDVKWEDGNYFLTEKEAVSYLDAIKLRMRMSHFAKTVTGVDEYIHPSLAFFINYHPNTNEFTVGSTDISKEILVGGFYPSREVAVKVIAKFGKEFTELTKK